MLDLFTPKDHACKEEPRSTSLHLSEPVHSFVASLAALSSWTVP